MQTRTRLCSCGQPIGPTGECAACAAKRQARPPADRPAAEAVERPAATAAAPAAHDFAAVRVHANPGRRD